MVNAFLNLSDFNGSNGFVINGINAGDLLGNSVSSAGDINGDGLDDLIIGAFGADPNGQPDAGQSYVVFGSSSGFAASLNPSELGGRNGFVINGINTGDNSGFFVSSAGDFNGDGFDDVIIGTLSIFPYFYSANESYVLFGSSSGFDASLNLSSLDGSNGVVINYTQVSSVSSAGDINGDGFDDVIIGKRGFIVEQSYNNRYYTGSSYVVFGNSSGFTNSSLIGSAGGSVSSAGDINGDGIDDLIIGAIYADLNIWSNQGSSYVIFGSSTNSGFNLQNLNGSNGFVISSIPTSGFLSISVSNAGDFNGDGFDDLIIGAPGADPNGQSNAGQSYVVFGSSSGFAASLNLAELDGRNGFVINGINTGDNSGFFVSSAGDFNGDGFDDLIIGAPGADPNGQSNAGSSYVVFGSSSIFASLNLSSLDGSNGFVINGINAGDYSISWRGSGKAKHYVA